VAGESGAPLGETVAFLRHAPLPLDTSGVQPKEPSVKTAMRKATEVVTIGAALYWELARSALRLLPGSVERQSVGS
jgi:hypothetical protein